MERKKRTSWQERMQKAILYLHEHHLAIDDNLYSFSGKAVGTLVRQRLVKDNAIIPVGRCCEGGKSQLRVSPDLLDKVEEALERLKGKGRPIDRHLHDRTLFRLEPDRLDELSGQLEWEEPHFSAREDHTGRVSLDPDENKGREPDLTWDY
ncbi:MAG: hypothetical protein CEN92_379 [Candidatus Berkelbacteria bacterium Licking1014_96]|uniref:Uncharacterized protein n=1 Tax=Candidatus Berkelbacteria bacterium Licking1014_96 TaxID=2017149 RepID=A0A554LD89_9BACT|nr:MAG: hypothetical protein CEN92_379 [Candidatus Berkelbacteria bacterium Licking1014_96]